MKIRKTLFSLILVISMLFVSVVEAAAPSSFTLVRDTSIPINGNASGGHTIVPGDGSFTPVYFPFKYSSGTTNYLVFCSGNRSANIDSSLSFKQTSFTNAYDGAIAAAIMKEGVGENATTSGYPNDTLKEKVFITQLAIWKLLPNTGNSFASTESAFNATQKTTYNNLLNVGNAAKTKYNEINSFDITLSASSLTFTLKGDKYESQVIKVSGKQIKTITPSLNKGTYEERDGGYVVIVPKNVLETGKNTITLTIKAVSESISVARNYTNGHSDDQTTTITQFDSFSKEKTKSISGDITVTTSVSISKQDITNSKELPGATLKLKYPDGTEKTWVSSDKPYVLENLPAGKYTLTETIAPDGYVKSSETITFNVKSDGTVDKNPVVMKNAPKGDVYISKVDATTGKELPGAKLELKDSKGNIVDSWTSEATSHKVKVKLSAGKYTLTETIAPKGYVKNTKTVEFTVKEDGTVDKPVIMENKPKGRVYISKQDITTGEELLGAILVLTDKNGREIDSWTSGTTPHMVNTILEAGTYTLTETIAPEGYIKSSETVTFKVKEDGTTDGDVVMYNKPEEPPENPKTGSTLIYSLMIAFVSFAVSLYYYSDTKLKGSK